MCNSIIRPKSRKEHYQTRKQDYNQKPFCHCHRLIYDRINKVDKDKTRQDKGQRKGYIVSLNETILDSMSCRDKKEKRGVICSKTLDNSSDITVLTEFTTASPAFILSCHCNCILLILKRPRDTSTFFNMTDVQ